MDAEAWAARCGPLHLSPLLPDQLPAELALLQAAVAGDAAAAGGSSGAVGGDAAATTEVVDETVGPCPSTGGGSSQQDLRSIGSLGAAAAAAAVAAAPNAVGRSAVGAVAAVAMGPVTGSGVKRPRGAETLGQQQARNARAKTLKKGLGLGGFR